MSALDRDKARTVATGIARGDYDTVEDALDALEECVPLGWESIWQDLNEIYAEDIIPTRSVPADNGNGPQVVSLLRLLGRAEAKLAAIAELCAREAQAVRDDSHDVPAIVADMALEPVRAILRGEQQSLTGV